MISKITFLASCMALMSACANLEKDTPDWQRSAACDAVCSYYVVMPDGVKIAVTEYTPRLEMSDAKAPGLFIQTRYGRSLTSDVADGFRAHGYGVVVVDTRGAAASFGPRRVDIGPEQVADMEVLISHIASLPWSNSEVFAYGTSYLADTADIATSRPAPELKGATIRQVDFDIYRHLFFPGGVANDWFLEGWGSFTEALDTGRLNGARDEAVDCLARVEDCEKLAPFVVPVDADTDYSLLRQALAGRERWSADDYKDAHFHDSPGANGYSLFDSSPASHLDGLRREAKPAQVWGSWMDAGTAAAALARFKAAPEVSMELWITANDHVGEAFGDPFFPDVTDPRPSISEQFEIVLDFHRRVRRGEPLGRRIIYSVLGAEGFRQTETWPPIGVEPHVYYLQSPGQLSSTKPTDSITDVYDVDFSHTTGPNTRWSTQFGGVPAYPDRSEAGQILQVYDSEPLSEDMEMAGTPVIDITLASETSDPVIFAYLELLSPDGRATYITEGVLRAVHRRIADPNTLAFDPGPAPKSFREADTQPVTPGALMELSFAFHPVAARLPEGSRIRLAIAGADKEYFRQYSNGEAETFYISTGGTQPSRVTLPLRPWQDIKRETPSKDQMSASE